MYCIAAIWSNLELFLGIIAANLTLSRAVYLHFFRADHDQSVFATHSHTSEVRSNRFHFGSGSRGDRVSRTETRVESTHNMERVMSNRSSNSEIELVPGIQKNTEFWSEANLFERARDKV